MKFIKIDGSVGECKPLPGRFEDFLIQTEEETSFVLPAIPVDTPLEELISSTMSVIAMRPPYLPESQIPWLLAYMDGLTTFAKRDANEIRHYQHRKGKVENYLLDRIYGVRPDEVEYRQNFIEITRKFASVSVLMAHLYGTKLSSQFSFQSNYGDPAHPYIIGALESLSSSYTSHNEINRHCLDFMDESGFKTMMTREFFKGACGVFQIPDGMIFRFKSMRGDEILESGTCMPFEVERFFGTIGGWIDGYQTIGWPEAADNTSPNDIELVPKIRSRLGRPSLEQPVMLELPLSWITHIVDSPRFPRSIEQISVSNISNHNFPTTIDKSMNEEIRNTFYEQGIKGFGDLSSAIGRKPSGD